MASKIPVKLLKAKAAGVYAVAEHGCAVAYAACEFFNAHLLLVGLSMMLLGAAVALIALRTAEAV